MANVVSYVKAFANNVQKHSKPMDYARMAVKGGAIGALAGGTIEAASGGSFMEGAKGGALKGAAVGAGINAWRTGALEGRYETKMWKKYTDELRSMKGVDMKVKDIDFINAEKALLKGGKSPDMSKSAESLLRHQRQEMQSRLVTKKGDFKKYNAELAEKAAKKAGGAAAGTAARQTTRRAGGPAGAGRKRKAGSM